MISAGLSWLRINFVYCDLKFETIMAKSILRLVGAAWIERNLFLRVLAGKDYAPAKPIGVRKENTTDE